MVTASRGSQFLEELWRNAASPQFHRKRSWARPSPKQAVCLGAAASLVGVRLPCCLLHKSELPQPPGTETPVSGFWVCLFRGVGLVRSPVLSRAICRASWALTFLMPGEGAGCCVCREEKDPLVRGQCPHPSQLARQAKALAALWPLAGGWGVTLSPSVLPATPTRDPDVFNFYVLDFSSRTSPAP